MLFSSAHDADAFFTASAQSWPACSNRQYTVTVAGATRSGVHRGAGLQHQRHPERHQNPRDRLLALESCQRALTVANNVAIDVQACSQTSPTPSPTPRSTSRIRSPPKYPQRRDIPSDWCSLSRASPTFGGGGLPHRLRSPSQTPLDAAVSPLRAPPRGVAARVLLCAAGFRGAGTRVRRSEASAAARDRWVRRGKPRTVGKAGDSVLIWCPSPAAVFGSFDCLRLRLWWCFDADGPAFAGTKALGVVDGR